MNIGTIIKSTSASVLFKDENGLSFEVSTNTKNQYLELKQIVLSNENGKAEIKLAIKNISKQKLYIQEAAVIDINAQYGGNLDIGGGVNSWTMLSGGLNAGVVDLCNPCHDSLKLDYYAPYYSLLGNRQTGNYALFAFMSFSRQDSQIRLHAVNPGFKFGSLQAVCDFCNTQLASGNFLETEILLIDTSVQPDEMMHNYFNLLAERFEVKQNFKDIIGWATWDYYQADISEYEVLKNMEWLKSRRNTIPVEYIQIDHGFQNWEGDWLDTNEKFPHGLKWLADQILEAGFKPGLWLCPFLVAPQSKVFIEHPEWMVMDANGKPLEVTGYAVKKVYALDCSIPEVCDWLKELARTVTVDYAYDYIKIDGANEQGMSSLGVLADSQIAKGEAMQKGVKAFRSGMKSGSFLLNACLFGLSIANIDGMRVGDDVGGRWDASKIDKHHGERDRFNGPGEVLRSIAATMNHYQQHKKLWVNDPDYLVVRQAGCNSELSYEEARSWASVVGVSNGLVMLGDDVTELLPERVKLIEKVIPHYNAVARTLDFFQKDVPSIYDLKVENKSENWHVVTVVNTDIPKRNRDYIIDFKEIGLEPDKEYLIFDFWESEFLGFGKESFTVKSLNPHNCKVMAIREKQNVPQVISTDIHLTQGGIEIKSAEYSNGIFKLETAALSRTGKVFFFAPESFTPDSRLKKISKNIYSTEISFDGSIIKFDFIKK